MVKNIFTTVLVIFLFFVLFPVVQSEPKVSNEKCNDACIVDGSTFGVCKESCSPEKGESEISQIPGCTKVGSASVVIGVGASIVYGDGDPFIGEDATNPKWVWVLSGLTTNGKSDIISTTTDSSNTGPLIGVKNNFEAVNRESTTTNALAKSESFCFPNTYLCIKYFSLTNVTYTNYEIKYGTFDLSNVNASWTSKPALQLQAVGLQTGLRSQRANYLGSSLSADITTDFMWLTKNNTNIAVIYEDNNDGAKRKIAGDLLLDEATDNFNFADVEYGNTKETNVQLNIGGNISAANKVFFTIDILGEEGISSSDGRDDIVINITHAANGDFSGLGATGGSAESSEVTWGNTSLGTKQNDLLTYYGIKILNQNTNGASDKVSLSIPSDQVKATVKFQGNITRQSTTVKKNQTETRNVTILSPQSLENISNPRNYNIIVVGNPCTNPLITMVTGITCVDFLVDTQPSLRLRTNGAYQGIAIIGKTPKEIEDLLEILFQKEKFNIDGSGIKITYSNTSDGEKIIVFNQKNTSSLNLKNFPSPFIENFNYNNLLVSPGYDTKKLYNVSQGIISKLRNYTSQTIIIQRNETSTSSFSSSLSDDIPIGNALSDSGFLSTRLDSISLESLLDSTVTFRSQKYPIHEEIVLFSNGPSIESSLSSLDDGYGTTVYMELKKGRLRYYYLFDNTIDLGLVSGTDPITLKILDKEITITSVDSATKFSTQQGKEYFLNVGDSLTVENKKVTLVDATNSQIVVDVNGTKGIIPNQTKSRVNELDIKNVQSFGYDSLRCCCSGIPSFV